MGLGGDYMIVPLVTAELFGIQRLGLLLGVILTSNGVAEAVSPWLGFFTLIGTALLGALAAAVLPKGQRAT